MKRSDLVEIIRRVVKEELQEYDKQTKKYIRSYVPIVLGEAVNNYIDEKIDEIKQHPTQQRSISKAEKLADKHLSLTESQHQFGNKSKLTALLGYGPSEKINTVTSIVTDSGREVPIDENDIPNDIKEALNKDYRSFLKKLDESTQNYRSGPRGS